MSEVADFYESHMPEFGWELFATGQGTTENQLLIFQRRGEIATLAIIRETDDRTLVLLTK